MADDLKTLIGAWDVKFQQYRWVYTFFENGTVKWLDPNNKQNGSGKWTVSSNGIALTWNGSKTTELWTTPITARGQGGTMTSTYAEGSFSADKRNPIYDSFSPEGQLDCYACWAASIAWLSKVSPDITTQSQSSFLNRAQPGQYTREGMITLDGLFNLNMPGYMRRERAKADAVRGYLEAGIFPMMIGYRNGPLGGHMNVIYGYSPANNGTVKVMDPWFPDPDKNKLYAPLYEGSMLIGYFKKGSGEAFRFTGSYQTRPFAFFQARPFDAEQFFIMYETSKRP
jgi:hypothetical protein